MENQAGLMQYIECLFIKEELGGIESSPLMDVSYFGHDQAMEYVAAQMDIGVRHFFLFGIPVIKTLESGANPQSDLTRLIRNLKSRYGETITLVSDVGLSPYQENGHSVVFSGQEIDLHQSYEAAGKLAVNFTRAGADYVAPCLSLPDQVRQIRQALNSENLDAKIMPYSAKFSSALYGPYRKAVNSALGKTRKSYQTDFRNVPDAFKQAADDVEHGASVVIVKPGSYYLDVLLQINEANNVPVAVFQVSGEYMMIKRAAEFDGMNEDDLFDEIHSAFSRCGATYVIGYAASHFQRWKQ